MSTHAIEVPAHSTYGAVELKEWIRKNTVRGAILAFTLIALLLIAYISYEKITQIAAAGKKPPVAKLKLTNLPPPPSNAQSTPPPPPTTTVAAAGGPAARAGAPVPVPDALLSPDLKDFANVNEISRASTEGGSGEDFGGIGEGDGGVDLSGISVEKKETDPDPDEFMAVDQEPSVDLGELQKQVVYPEMAKRNNIEGKVAIRVLVGKNGKVKKHIIEQTDSELLNKAAIDAVYKATFKPALQNKDAIDCWVSIPIVFKLR